MSAIAALWHVGSVDSPTDECFAMIAAQRRYGPDSSHVAGIAECALGRALFRLLPEDASDRQPLYGGNGRYLIAGDLRLDNRADLISRLEIDAATVAKSADADLLCLAWERWRENLFPYLVGDYAFIVFDRHERTLTIARDPLGQRPLFWQRKGDRVAVASMPAGLHALPWTSREPDAERAARHLVMLDEGQRSFWRGIQRVRPGHVVTLHADRTDVRRHWQPRSARLAFGRFDDYVDAYREQLDRAVATRLRRVEPQLGAQLSGGWDSSAVTATAARLLPSGERLTAFTAVPRARQPDDERIRFHDEGPLAGAVTALYPNIDHVLVPHPLRSPLDGVERHRKLYGRPMVNLCNHVWLADIRQKARSAGIRVMLTGELGNFTISNSPNTLLADHIRRGDWMRWGREAFGMLRDRRARIRGVLATSFEPWVPRSIWHSLERFGSGLPSRFAGALHPDWQARFADEIEDRHRSQLRRDHRSSTLHALEALDLAEYHKGVLGGWGIDKRDPTVDVRLLDFMLSLPPAMFLDRAVRRPLARAALADRLPEAILAERRKGYQAADWHEGLTADRSRIASLVDRIAADPVAAGVIDVDLLRRLLADWPRDGWSETEVIGTYRLALLNGLSTGSFLLDA